MPLLSLRAEISAGGNPRPVEKKHEYADRVPRHHVVPQMLLRRFADERDMLTVVDRTDPGRTHESKVKKACNETDLYVIPTDDLVPGQRDGHDPQVVEKQLSKIEYVADVAIRELLQSGLPLTHQARLHLSVFMALQHTRGWQFRRDLEDATRIALPHRLREVVTPERVREILQARGEESDDASVREWVRRLTEPGAVTASLRKGQVVQHMMLNALEVVAPTLFARQWRLLEFSAPMLLISDQPLAMMPIDGIGFGTAREVWFPLGRTHALEMTLQGTEGVVRSTNAKARKINSFVAAQAEKWIFHHPEDSPMTGLTLPARTSLVEEVVTVAETEDSVLTAHRIVRRPGDT